MASSEEVVEAANACAEIYTANVTTGLLALWERVLLPLPSDVLIAAVDEILRGPRDRMPPPGVVLQRARSILRSRAEALLVEIRKQATREGQNGREIDTSKLSTFTPETLEAMAVSGLLWARSFHPHREGTVHETQAAEFVDAYVSGYTGERKRLPGPKIVALLDERKDHETKRLRA
jgi:hypothetical protein